MTANGTAFLSGVMKCFGLQTNKQTARGAWLAQLVEHDPDLRVLSSSPKLGIEIT